MLYIFRVSNGALSDDALIVPIEAASADEAWGRFHLQEGNKWQNVTMQDIGTKAKVGPGIKRSYHRMNRPRKDRPTPRFLGDV